MSDADRQEVAGLRIARAAEAAMSEGKQAEIGILGRAEVINCLSVKAGVITTTITSQGGVTFVVSTPAITFVQIT